jgi:hypothetical protein
MDMREKFSLLWIFAIFNYIYADYLSFLEPGILEQLMTGSIDGLQFTQGMLLGAAVLMETAIAMVILSRVLEYRANRLANIIVGIIHTLSVFLSMFVGTPALFYIFFGTIEMATTLLIVRLAWKWPNPEGN